MCVRVALLYQNDTVESRVWGFLEGVTVPTIQVGHSHPFSPGRTYHGEMYTSRNSATKCTSNMSRSRTSRRRQCADHSIQNTIALSFSTAKAFASENKSCLVTSDYQGEVKCELWQLEETTPWGDWNRDVGWVNLGTVCKYGWIFVIFWEGGWKRFNNRWNLLNFINHSWEVDSSTGFLFYLHPVCILNYHFSPIMPVNHSKGWIGVTVKVLHMTRKAICEYLILVPRPWSFSLFFHAVGVHPPIAHSAAISPAICLQFGKRYLSMRGRKMCTRLTCIMVSDLCPNLFANHGKCGA